MGRVKKKCVHHWVLEETTREGTRGACKNCNAEKKWPPSTWDGSSYTIVPERAHTKGRIYYPVMQ